MATILYAEDSPVMRRVVAGILRDKGHVVIEAASYDELKANAKANKGKIDLVISDVQLERVKKTAHGIVFYNSLRKTDEEQPIILLSAALHLSYADYCKKQYHELFFLHAPTERQKLRGRFFLYLL